MAHVRFDTYVFLPGSSFPFHGSLSTHHTCGTFSANFAFITELLWLLWAIKMRKLER